MSGQEEPNTTLWLATQASKMELSCPLRTTCWVLQETFLQNPYNKSFIDQACLVKMGGYWLCSFSRVFMELDCIWVHKHTKKELGKYPAILTSHLVNNLYYNGTLLICSPMGCKTLALLNWFYKKNDWPSFCLGQKKVATIKRWPY